MIDSDDIKWFWGRVDVSRSDTGCWEFGNPKSKNTYHRITFGGKQYMSHRLSYEIANGKIPDGMFICHTCDNPRCVNPDHLYAGTHKDNARDCVERGRRNIHNYLDIDDDSDDISITTMSIKRQTKDRLNTMGCKSDSYDDIINRVIDGYWKRRFVNMLTERGLMHYNLS